MEERRVDQREVAGDERTDDVADDLEGRQREMAAGRSARSQCFSVSDAESMLETTLCPNGDYYWLNHTQWSPSDSTFEFFLRCARTENSRTRVTRFFIANFVTGRLQATKGVFGSRYDWNVRGEVLVTRGKSMFSLVPSKVRHNETIALKLHPDMICKKMF